MKVCTLASGSSGNSTYVGTDNASVLVDAGLSGRAIVQRLDSIGVDPCDIDGILVTHEHSDHIKGVGVLARKYDLKVYGNEQTWGELDKTIGHIPEYNRCVLESGTALEIEDLKIEHFEMSHDAVDSIGFSFYNSEVKVSIATDTGYLTRSARQYIDGSDLFIFEANHDLQMLKKGRYPWFLKERILSDRGHLSNIAAGHCLASLVSGKTKGVILAHLSKENNLPDIAYTTVAEVLESSGIFPDEDLALEVAPRCTPGKVWNLG